ncbi:helix-turn-helix domain-containing protein [Colwelliaceae bacterium 6441]
MIVKKLRANKNWSQEQVAILSGLSLRTIQRVESGQSASIETLKSLASVFEVEISILTEEVTVIDKTSENWKNQPWWFKFLFWGIGSRKLQVTIEKGLLALGIVAFFIEPVREASPILLLGAYCTCLAVRQGDNKNLWSR